MAESLTSHIVGLTFLDDAELVANDVTGCLANATDAIIRGEGSLEIHNPLEDD